MIRFSFFSEHSSCNKGNVLEDDGMMRNQSKTS